MGLPKIRCFKMILRLKVVVKNSLYENLNKKTASLQVEDKCQLVHAEVYKLSMVHKVLFKFVSRGCVLHCVVIQ